MEKITLKPEKEQRTLWFITWAIVFIIGTPFWIVTPFFVLDILIFFGVFLFVWLVIMILVAIWIPAAFKALEYTIDEDWDRADININNPNDGYVNTVNSFFNLNKVFISKQTHHTLIQLGFADVEIV